MARDDLLDKELSELEKEIEEKVDSLFVEMEEGALAAEDDPWKYLKELFLTLEWEIDENTLGKIASEAEALQERFPEGATGTLLGWIAQMARKVADDVASVDQRDAQLLMDLKDALFQVVEDPFKDASGLLEGLRPRMERSLVGVEEEAPTITLESALGGEMEKEPWTQGLEAPLKEEEVPPVEEAPLKAVEGIPEGERVQTLEEQVERIKQSISECAKRFNLLASHLSQEDPLGLKAAFETLSSNLKGLAQSLAEATSALGEQVEALLSLELIPKPKEPESPPEAQARLEEILFVSVSNRIFGIPMESVRGVFRVPYRAVPEVLKLSEVTLRDKKVPLVSLWQKMGVGRALFTLPREEKRILLVDSQRGEVGVLVDRVIARKETVVRPVEEAQLPIVRGAVTVEKTAYVLDCGAL